MTRSGRRSARDRRGERVATYRGRMSLIALAVSLVATAVLVVLQRQLLHDLIHQLRGPRAHVGASDLVLIARFVAIPLATGVSAYLLADQAIRFLRLIVYLRSLHRYAARMLQTHAPLRLLGYSPRLVTVVGSAAPKGERGRHPHDVAMAAQRTLAVGDEGSGKSVALWSVVYQGTRRRLWLPIYVGSAPLPIVASLSAYADVQSEQDDAWMSFLVRQTRVFGTAGLAARLRRRLRKRPALFICDDLDALGPRLLRRWVASLEQVDKTSKKPHRVMASVNRRRYEEDPAQYAALRHFAMANTPTVSQQEIAAVLRRARGMPDTRRGKPGLIELLQSHQLALPVEQPAHLAALVSLWRAAPDLPYGRAQLWDAALDLYEQAQPDEAPADAGITATLGQIASALVRANTRVIPVAPGRSLGRAVAEWLSVNPPLFPLEVQAPESSELSPEQIEVHCRRALQAGLLVRSPDGSCLQFAHHVLHAALASRWLRVADDGLGRLNAELLQEQWIMPVLLWGGAIPASGDLAARLARLADTPDATAIRADLAAREDVLPIALALAFAVAVEGISYQLSKARERDADYERIVPITEHHLRDLLDPAAVYLSEPEQQDRLTTALRAVRACSGPEIVACSAELIRTPDFGRLARAQLISMLGVMATPDAVSTCVDLLAETDPVIRQAVNQAMIYAGPAALDPLRRALTDADEHVRSRAAEALALLGDVAFDTAVTALHGSDARQRAAAVRTVSVLGASQVVGEVIARLDDEDRHVRIAAARALGQVATPEALEALALHITTTDPAFRIAVAKALGATRDADALSPLLTLLQDQDGQVRAAAAAALGVLGDERAANALRQRREDHDVLAQHAALTALRRLGQTA